METQNMNMFASDFMVQKRTARITLLVLIEGKKFHLPAQQKVFTT